MNLSVLAQLARNAHPESALLKKADEVSTETATMRNLEEELMSQIKTGQLKNDVATFLAVRDRLLSGEKVAGSLLSEEIDSVGDLDNGSQSGTGSGSYETLINDMIHEFSRGG